MPAAAKTKPRAKAPEKVSAAPYLIIAVLAALAVLSFYALAAALIAIGVVLIVLSVTIIAEADKIWGDYKRYYKAKGRKASRWTEPRELYRQLNVYLLWPAALLLGMASLAVGIYLA